MARAGHWHLNWHPVVQPWPITRPCTASFTASMPLPAEWKADATWGVAFTTRRRHSCAAFTEQAASSLSFSSVIFQAAQNKRRAHALPQSMRWPLTSGRTQPGRVGTGWSQADLAVGKCQAHAGRRIRVQVQRRGLCAARGSGDGGQGRDARIKGLLGRSSVLQDHLSPKHNSFQ